RRPHKSIVRNIKFIAHLLKKTGHFVCECPRLDAFGARRLSHLQPVFVGAGLESYVATLLPLETGDHIGGNRLIGMTDMRGAVGVADRRRDVEGLGHLGRALAGAAYRFKEAGGATSARIPPIWKIVAEGSSATRGA